MDKPQRPCPFPGCAALVRSRGPCPRHQHPAGHDALYDSRWTTLSARTRRAVPVCQRCRQRPATEVHHVRNARAWPSRRLDPANVVALCHPCHAAVT